MGLAPMAVLPARQRAGIGSALVRDGLERCQRAWFRSAVVVGHPEYYPRFGFSRASALRHYLRIRRSGRRLHGPGAGAGCPARKDGTGVLQRGVSRNLTRARSARPFRPLTRRPPTSPADRRLADSLDRSSRADVTSARHRRSRAPSPTCFSRSAEGRAPSGSRRPSTLSREEAAMHRLCAALLLVCLSGAVPRAQEAMSREQRSADLEALASLYAKNYGPTSGNATRSDSICSG